MAVIAVLFICAGCVSALTISSSVVRTEDGEQSMTSSSSSSSSQSSVSSFESETSAEDTEGDVDVLSEESGEILSAESTNCTETQKPELIISFQPQIFELSDGTLDQVAMKQAENSVHGTINATILSDLTEQGMPGIQLVLLPEGMSIEEGIAYYESLPEIRFAEPNYQISIYSDECIEAASAEDEEFETTDGDYDSDESEIPSAETEISTSDFSF
jgi:hypothetical protein